MKERTYIAIDLKSFYASVECRERGLDPLDTNLVVADESRTDKTICLAVTPSLKSYGISGRGRLFEVKQRVKEANAGRQHDAPGHKLDGSSCFHSELLKNPNLAIDFVIAPPRMAYYMEYSTRIYNVYLKYVAPEDIVVYSIDEVFMDVTDYLSTYKLSPHDLAMKIILDVLETTGITATAGIGTNLFLSRQPQEAQSHLYQVYETIRAALPDAREKISWSMPTFWNGCNLIQFACNKTHIGLYPGPEAVEAFADRLKGYKTNKGTIRLPLDQGIPIALIVDIARWCWENSEVRSPE